MITDEEGRIERFLEKPSWGQVFSDTINTGVYVLEPEVLQTMPDGRALRLLQAAVPRRCSSRGMPMYGWIADGYWQDIGTLEQYLAANMDVLDGRCG